MFSLSNRISYKCYEGLNINVFCRQNRLFLLLLLPLAKMSRLKPRATAPAAPNAKIHVFKRQPMRIHISLQSTVLMPLSVDEM